MIDSLDEIEKDISVIEERIENLEGEVRLRKIMIYNLKSRLRTLIDERELCLRGMDKRYDKID